MIVPSSERGAALLTVLLLVALMATISAAALDRIGLATRLAGNVATVAQARNWLGTAELLATTRLENLLAADQSQTTLVGNWHGTEQSLPTPDGALVRARVTDAGNCFNLNGLVQRGAGGRLTERLGGRAQFTGLMGLLGIAPGEADRVASGTVDYLDSDVYPLPAGAEDAGDGALPANGLMADASELRTVAGVTARHFALLERWLCALPMAEPAPINVNTLAPEQALLLAMLAPDALDVARARAQIAARPAAGFGSVADFWNSPVLRGVDVPDEVAGQVRVRSQFFLLRASVRSGDLLVEESALIDARKAPARIVRRDWSAG